MGNDYLNVFQNNPYNQPVINATDFKKIYNINSIENTQQYFKNKHNSFSGLVTGQSLEKIKILI